MLNGLFILSIVYTLVCVVKDMFTPTIPAENWENMELYRKDIIDGVPIEQRLKYVKDGRYKVNK
jgi:hypothetical protein